jgi:hypothetical protein
MRKILTCVLFAGGWLFLAGNTECTHDYYEIEMLPKGQELERKLTVSRVGYEEDKQVLQVFDPSEIKRIAALYAERLTKPDELKHSFKDKFLVATPKDVGGQGSYLHLTSLVGSASAYQERFRGYDDQAARLQKSLDGMERLLGWFKGWAVKELKEHPGLGRLTEFLDKKVRQDMRNLVIYTALGERLVDFDPKATEEMGVRMFQYLAERGYFKIEQLPKLSSAWYRGQVSDAAVEIMALVQRLVARELGIDDSKPVPKELDFLADTEKAAASLSEYLRTTPEFTKLMVESEAKDKPDPMSMLTDLLLTEIIQLELGTEDVVTIRLKTPAKPFATNGKWKDGQVEWLKKAVKGKSGLPTFTYAYWSSPDAKFQRKHFGKVILSGENLGEYVLWRSGLNSQEGMKWDDFLKTLKPGKPEVVLERVAAFRFKGEEPQGKTLAETPIRLIGLGLGAGD